MCHRPATSTSARVPRLLVDSGQLHHLRRPQVHSDVRHHEHRRPHRHRAVGRRRLAGQVLCLCVSSQREDTTGSGLAVGSCRVDLSVCRRQGM